MSVGTTTMEFVLPTLRMHEAYAGALIGDLSEVQLDASPGPGLENTPRFTIGHLCVGCAMTRRGIQNPGGDRYANLDVPDVFVEQFGRKGPQDRRIPEARPNAPGVDELLSEFGRQHDELNRAVRAAPDDALNQPCSWKLGHLLPRHVDLVMFVCTHEALHLGQLAAWRRAKGLDAAMARMIADAPNV